MTRILLCIFLMISCLFKQAATAQNKPAAVKTDTMHTLVATPHKDSIRYIPGGIRIGLDLSRIVSAIYYPYRKEVTVIADAHINNNLYAAFEGGYANTPYSDSNYTYKGNGTFVTLGIDYNLLKKLYPSEKNMLYVGFRYGFSHFNYEIPTYSIRNSYWGEHITSNLPATSLNAHWVELLVGLKAEICRNFFIGWNIRERILINRVKTDNFTPLTIPGFGNGGKRSVFDVQYTLSYVIPFYRVKEKMARKGAKSL